MIPGYVEAIQSLAPEADFVIRGSSLSGLEWLSTSIAQPSKEEIEIELERLLVSWNASEYQRRRAAEYPRIDELIVALWESTVEGRPATAAELQALREAIKAKYPKPS